MSLFFFKVLSSTVGPGSLERNKKWKNGQARENAFPNGCFGGIVLEAMGSVVRRVAVALSGVEGRSFFKACEEQSVSQSVELGIYGLCTFRGCFSSSSLLVHGLVVFVLPCGSLFCVWLDQSGCSF